MHNEDTEIWKLYTEANTPVVEPKWTSAEKAKFLGIDKETPKPVKVTVNEPKKDKEDEDVKTESSDYLDITNQMAQKGIEAVERGSSVQDVVEHFRAWFNANQGKYQDIDAIMAYIDDGGLAQDIDPGAEDKMLDDFGFGF